MILLPFFFFFLGLCVGSFLNVVVDRFCSTSQESKSLLRHLRGVLMGRSYCDHCRKQLAWYDLIPLLSFVFLKEKCRYCGKRISWQYPLVESTTGAVFSIWYIVYSIEGMGGMGEFLFFLFISSALIAIFVSDLKYQIIPDQVVYPAIGITLIYRLLSCSLHLVGVHSHTSEVSLWSSLLTGLGAMGFFLFLHLITKGKGMGLGDVKLAFLMGLLLGWSRIIIALYFAFLTGALVGVILILTGKKKFGQHIPFGPFLVGGTFVSLFWGEKILGCLGI